MANPETTEQPQVKPRGPYRVAATDATSGQFPAAGASFERYRQLIDRVTDVFGDETIASRWLSTPSGDFNSQPPIEVAQQHGYDVAVLEPILIRIEHGVDF